MEISSVHGEAVQNDHRPKRSLTAFQDRIIDILTPLMSTYGNASGSSVRQSVHSTFDPILRLHEIIGREGFLKETEERRAPLIVASFVDAVHARPIGVLWQRLPDAIPITSDAYPTAGSAVAARGRAASHMLTGGLLDASYAVEVSMRIRQFQRELWGRFGLSRHIPLIRGRAAFDEALDSVAKSIRAACGWRVAARLGRIVGAEPAHLLPVAHVIGDIHYCRLLADLSGSPDTDRWRLAAEATPHAIPLGIVAAEGGHIFVLAHHSA